MCRRCQCYVSVKKETWINVKDELPEHTGVVDGGTDNVMVWVKKQYAPHIYIGSGDYTEDGFIWYVSGVDHLFKKDYEVTHWRPLPTDKPEGA